MHPPVALDTLGSFMHLLMMTRVVMRHLQRFFAPLLSGHWTDAYSDGDE